VYKYTNNLETLERPYIYKTINLIM